MTENTSTAADSQPDVYDLLGEDPTVPVVDLTDTDLGVVATVTWPRLRGAGHITPGQRPYADAWPERIYVTRLADLIREHCPRAELWWPLGCEYLAIRQATRDVVALPGDTLVIAAGEVSRTAADHTSSASTTQVAAERLHADLTAAPGSENSAPAVLASADQAARIAEVTAVLGVR